MKVQHKSPRMNLRKAKQHFFHSLTELPSTPELSRKWKASPKRKQEEKKFFPSLKYLIERGWEWKISEEIFIDTPEKASEKEWKKKKHSKTTICSIFTFVSLKTPCRYHYIHCIVISAIYAPRKKIHREFRIHPETTQLFCCCERSGLYSLFDAFCYKNNNNIKVCFLHESL